MPDDIITMADVLTEVQIGFLAPRILEGIRKAVADEREACAMIAEEATMYHYACAQSIAQSIRSRSKNAT